MVLVGSRLGQLSIAAGIVCAVVSLGLAAITYIVIENPIRFAPQLAQRRAFSLTLAGVAALLGIATTGVWREIVVHTSAYKTFVQPINDVPRFYQFKCRTEFLEQEIRACSFGEVQSSKVVVLLGDSHAAQWFPPLERIANERGFRLVTMIKMACPAVAIPAYQSKIGREEEQCVAWRNLALRSIAELKPAAVVAATSVEYVNSSGEPLSYGQWRLGTHDTMTRLNDMGISTLLLRDTPKAEFNVPLCLARAAWSGSGECTLPRKTALDEDAFRAEQDALQGLDKARLADYSGQFCGPYLCAAEKEGKIVFRDRDHLTASFAETLTPALAASLEPLLR
jgi:hypothetical protein